ncbi:hypothetical protein KC622_03040, partial [Candidatus Dojkabacteria bacterium]|nr:hypothetical protein [Candidatus Dojkabacteria bacterium]
MFRKDIEKLIRHIEPQIISILVAHGLVKSSKQTQKFGDLKLTQKSKGILGLSDLIITDDWVREWQQKWPPGHLGAFSTTKDKLIRYLLEHD